MQLEGMILTRCPAETIILLAADPAALQKIMPDGCEIGERSGETVPFLINRKIGPINLTMHGELTLRKKPGSPNYTMLLKASHLVAGRVNVVLDLAPRDAATGKNTLTWTGTLETHGLASRLVEERGDRVQTILSNMFKRLRDQAEGAA